MNCFQTGLELIPELFWDLKQTAEKFPQKAAGFLDFPMPKWQAIFKTL